MKTALLWFWLLTTFAAQAQDSPLVTLRRTAQMMNTEVTVTITAESEEIGYIHIEEALAEIRLVEQQITSRDPDSEVSAINANAGVQPVPVSPGLYSLLERVVQISVLTTGAFDVTAAALDTLWRIDGSLAQIPDSLDVAPVLPLVGYHKMELDSAARTAYLPEKGMKINLDGIGKGYAVDRVRESMRSRQVPGGTIQVGGEIAAWGTRTTGDKWLLGITDPLHIGQILQWIPLVESSVSIVRCEEQFIRRGDRIYGHILNPATGFPTGGVDRVIVLGRTAELSHALATALCVLGPEKGIRLIEYLGDTEAVIVDTSGIMYWTSGLSLEGE